jgi:hypothetical protein
MRSERRRILAAVLIVALALAAGIYAGGAYARRAAPFYAAAAALIAKAHPWKVNGVRVSVDQGMHGQVLRLTGEVRRSADDARPAAIIESHVQVGEVIETPVIFFSLLLLWPALTIRERVWRLALAVPAFFVLEILTTVCELLRPLAEASALLNGEAHPLTLWERWTRLLEAGGRFVLEIAGVILTVGWARKLAASRPRLPSRAAASSP